MDMDALPLALAEPPSEANLRTNSAGIQLCLLQEQDPRGNAGQRIGVRSAVGDWIGRWWGFEGGGLGYVKLTGNAAQCLATYSPRCVLNEFRLLHINYHGLAKRQSQAQTSNQTWTWTTRRTWRDSETETKTETPTKTERAH
uniref:HDC09719 n=1 Tax=Drosophila melanogaster TaxID=7227 RepID=Q6ILC7_DROME|nr:TPA_inf: HDC09719 [Drosophila melanogaster]